MKLSMTKLITTSLLVLTTNIAVADTAKSEKHANKATHLRHAVFTLLGANMGTLGGMAKGKIPFDAKVIEQNATRINQISYMISDYTKIDTSAYKVKTDALDKVWSERDAYEQKVTDLTNASAKLMEVSTSGDVKAIKSAIGGVGKTCGGCHDDFKKD
ncbi:MAG: c-type cytochrome [Colwellia sp.]